MVEPKITMGLDGVPIREWIWHGPEVWTQHADRPERQSVSVLAIQGDAVTLNIEALWYLDGESGVDVDLTPEDARRIAEWLVRAADVVEGEG